MIRRTVLLCALALAGALPSAAGAAAPERGVLVVAGQGGTTAELVLTEPVELRDVRPVLTGGGDYAGALVEAVDVPSPSRGPNLLGAVVVRAFKDATRDAVAVVGGDTYVDPGRYRVTLLGQGLTEVRWTLSDAAAPGVRVEPATPVTVTFLGRSELIAPGQGSAQVVLPRALPAGARALQLSLTEGRTVEDARMCATAGSECEGRPLPACLPSPVPCGDPALPTVDASDGQPAARVQLHAAAPADRALVWSTDSYYRDVEGRLRAAALVLAGR